MKRRDFIRIAGTAPFLPWERLATALQSGAVTDCAVKAAHLENTSVSSLMGLYTRHAEVARDIHAYAARQMAGTEIPVEWLKISGSKPDLPDISQMETLDVFSVSSALAGLGSVLSAEFEDNLSHYRKFWRNSSAIGVFAAGNAGETRTIVPHDTIESFGDTSLSVGEAGQNADGVWHVKSHSQNTGNISFVAPNPMDSGLRVHFFDQTPEIQPEHAGLIRRWVFDRDLNQRILEKHPEYTTLEEHQRGDIYRDLQAMMENDTTYRQTLEEQVQHYLANPDELHEIFLASTRAAGQIDADGLSGGLRGTSFTAPFVAGAIAAAKCLGKEREQQGKTALSSEDLVALALLATDPVTKMEKGADIPQEKNARGLNSSYRAGFGVFSPEKYKRLIHEACRELDAQPNLASEPRQIASKEKFRDKKDNHFILTLPKDGEDITIVKARLEYKSAVNDPPAVHARITSPSGSSFIINTTQGENREDATDLRSRYWHSWGSTDRFFGEQASGKWKIELLGESKELNVEEMSLTFCGVGRNGLIDKMIDRELGVEKEIPGALKRFLDRRSQHVRGLGE